MSEASVDPFSKVAELQGLTVWKVVGFTIEPVDSATHGEFATDSCYVVLSIGSQSDADGGRPARQTIHFWIGQHSSVDNASVAALQTIELTKRLSAIGRHAFQYRETQADESTQFVNCFPSGVHYLTTGSDGQSALRQSRANHEPRLFKVKGKRYARTCKVPITLQELNDGDAFVLDSEHRLVVWSGAASNKFERLAAWHIARRIRDADRLAKVTVESLESSDLNTFLDSMSLSGTITSASEGGDDAEFESSTKPDTIMYEVTVVGEEITTKEVASGVLRREALRTEHCYIVEDSVSGVFVWLGKTFSQNHTLEWTHILKRYPSNSRVRIARFAEGNELLAFQLLFSDWNCRKSTSETLRNDVLLEVRRLHLPQLHDSQLLSLPDDGDADSVNEENLKVWKVDCAGKKSLVPRDQYGLFYNAASYIVHYRTATGPLKHFVFFWQGVSCQTDEVMASALMAHKYNEFECSGKAKEIRICQNQETAHFFKIFKNNVTILLGGRSNKRNSAPVQESQPESGVRLFQIFTTNSYNTKAVEVKPRWNAFNSMDFFLLKTTNGSFSWKGKYCRKENIDRADSLKKFLLIDSVTEVNEGEESDEFKKHIEGECQYFDATYLTEDALSSATCCRFFQCFYKSHLVVEEVIDFTQLNLQEVEGSSSLIDAGNTIWVWIGKDANWHVRKATLNLAQEYIDSDESGRNSSNTPVYVVRQKFEPIGFTGLFHVWDYSLWNDGKAFEQLEKESDCSDKRHIALDKELEKYSRLYSHEELRNGRVPDGVDPCSKEERLREEDFEFVFQMSRSEFLSLPKWKQTQLKKNNGLG